MSTMKTYPVLRILGLPQQQRRLRSTACFGVHYKTVASLRVVLFLVENLHFLLLLSPFVIYCDRFICGIEAEVKPS